MRTFVQLFAIFFFKKKIETSLPSAVWRGVRPMMHYLTKKRIWMIMIMMLINSEIASITGVVLRPFDLDFFLFVNAFQPKQYRHRCF